MDLVAACRAFVHVADRDSFTVGAAAARVPQSVASRRIAALEEHFGERLFDRSGRRAVLTAFGRDMLPPAKRLVRLAEEMEYHAEQAKLRPFSLAVPGTCPVRLLARLDAAGREKGTVLDIRVNDPGDRIEMLRAGRIQAALLAVPPDGADWTVPLGVAARSDLAGSDLAGKPGGRSDDTKPLRVESLRPARGERSPRRIVIQPEDDVPHIRDTLRRLGHRSALLPAQITVAASLIAAASAATREGCFLLCAAGQAADLGLTWRPLAAPPETPLVRGYSVSALTSGDADRVRTDFGPHIAAALGAGE